MEVKIFWTNTSLIQLEKIFIFLKAIESTSYAQKVTQQIIDRTIYLKTNPYIGPKEPLLAKHKKEYHYLIEGYYKIIYRVDNNKVFVNAVFDCRQNPRKLKIT